MRNFFKTLPILVSVVIMTFISCTESEGPFGISDFHLFVRFQNADGRNLADSANVLGNDDIARLKADTVKDLHLRIERMNSGRKPVELGMVDWIKTKSSMNSSDLPNVDYGKMGTMLEIQFFDRSIWDKNDIRNEVYLLTFNSDKLFGNDENHTIKFYIHIYGRGQYRTYRCEVDGKEVPIDDVISDKRNYGLYGAVIVTI